MHDREDSDLLFRTLLKHFWMMRAASIPREARLYSDGYLISYGALCAQAGAPHLTTDAGALLYETAVFCEAQMWPPLHALVVKRDTQTPAEDFFHAPRRNPSQLWEEAAAEVIAFEGFPKKASLLSVTTDRLPHPIH